MALNFYKGKIWILANHEKTLNAEIILQNMDSLMNNLQKLERFRTNKATQSKTTQEEARKLKR